MSSSRGALPANLRPGQMVRLRASGVLSETIEVAGQSCTACAHADLHQPHPDGTGWPSTVLACASCPDGKCVLPETGDGAR